MLLSIMRVAFLVSIVAVLCLQNPSLRAEKILWAKGARHFGYECPNDGDTCALALVRSPNGKSTAKVSRQKGIEVFEIIEGSVHYRLPEVEDDPEVPFVQMEILWSPDSAAVSFAWNSTAITDLTRIYVVGNGTPKLVDISPLIRDFVKQYPPCVGTVGPCDFSANAPDTNCLTVAWSRARTVVLMVEAPETGDYGSNMAQVDGYEFDTSNGQVVRKMDARSFKHRWQSHMGWRFRIPGPPAT